MSPAGQGEDQLRHHGRGRKARALASAPVQARDLIELAPEVKPAAKGIDKDLAAVAGGFVGIGECELEPRFLFVNCRHESTSP